MNLDNLEVLSPAGSFESLRSAVDYGADAVYLGGQSFGMRAGSENFTYDSLKAAIVLAHLKGVKVYLTCNTLPRNNEIPYFRQFMEEANEGILSRYRSAYVHTNGNRKLCYSTRAL